MYQIINAQSKPGSVMLHINEGYTQRFNSAHGRYKTIAEVDIYEF